MYNEYFQIISLFYIVLLIFVFFLKDKQESLENKLYSYVLLSNFWGLIFDIFSYVCALHYKGTIIAIIANKLLLCYLCLYILLITLYMYIISHNIEKYDSSGVKISNNNLHLYKLMKKIIISIFIISVIIIFAFKIDLIYIEQGIYSVGLPIYYLYGLSSLCFLVWAFWFFKDISIIKRKEFVPIVAFMILSFITMIVQFNFPWLLLLVPVEAFVTFLMYFTIENPDMRLIEQLNIAKDSAEKANHAKSDFLSSMSHEIRTPLNAITGFSTGLLDQDLSSEAKEDVNNIITASNNLLELVNGILDISKIEAGKLEIVESNYSINKMFNELILLTKTRIGEKPIEFSYTKDPSLPEYFYGDGNRLKQIILNLLTNAAKYTKEGFIKFNISYVALQNSGRMIISVEDSGIGIKKENIDKLFTKFERLQVEKNTTVEGTGLGLAITKNLVELMGGKILVNSIEGQGSRFTVIVEQKITPMDEVIKLKDEENKINNVTEAHASGKKVLVVDDNNLNLKVAERLLKKYELNIETCLSGSEAIDKIIMGNIYDLILMDDMMPKLSGTDTLNKLKEISTFNIPVVVLTANAITGMKEQYLKAGFNDYLSKPIEKQELERVINRFLVK